MILLSWCGEELEKHLLDTMEAYKKIESKSIEVLLNRLAQYTSISDNFRNYLKFSVRLAMGMHDIGKAHPKYRLWNRDKLRLVCDKPRKYDCERFCKPDHIPKFRMHEIISGCIIMSYLNRLPFISEIGNPHSDTSLELIISLAVAYHHEAIHTPIDPQVEKYLSSHFNDWNPMQDQEAKTLIRRVVEEALDGASFGPTITQILDEFREAKLHFRRALEAWRTSSKPPVKLYSLIGGPLMICDSLIAARNRGGRAPRAFVSEALRALPELRINEKFLKNNSQA